METDDSARDSGLLQILIVVAGLHLIHRFATDRHPHPKDGAGGQPFGSGISVDADEGIGKIDGKLVTLETGGREVDYLLTQEDLRQLSETGEVSISIFIQDEQRSVNARVMI